MQEETLLHLIALLKVSGIGPVTARNLISYCGGVKEIFVQRPAALRKVPEVGPKTPVEELLRKSTFAEAELELKHLAKLNARGITFLDEDYPQMLKTLTHAPLLLFVRGKLDFNELPALAMVGTRKPTDYGRVQARHFAHYYAEMGFNVVSGLAYGIDIEVHKEVLAAGGITTAVVAHGLDRVYPAQHAKYAEQIVANGGAVVTEFFHGTAPDAVNFPSRNRIICGLSKGTIVVEAAETGGAMLTARIAFDQDREVFAIPGPLTSTQSEGCHRLIRENTAHLLSKPEDVIKDLNMEVTVTAQPTVKQLPLMSAEELDIYHHLNTDGVLLDDLAEKTGVKMSQLMSTLLAMEFKGAVRQLPGRKFVRA